jgi:hypothetical protein
MSRFLEPRVDRVRTDTQGVTSNPQDQRKVKVDIGRPQGGKQVSDNTSLGAAAADPARERRVKALGLTAPLHELEENKGLRGWQAYDCYDIALAAIDAVVDRMSFDSGIRRAELDTLVIEQAARFDPTAVVAVHRDVAVHVVETLIRPQQAAYVAASDQRRRRFDFRLLDEVDSGDGIYVRATNEAINVLVGALDTDLESAHDAAEARFESLIRRKRLPEASIAAKEARYRSIQYMIDVARYIGETKRDYRRAGWHDQIPARLAEMMEHLKGRMEVERRLLTAMRETRDEAEREDHRRQAAELVMTVEDCFARHNQLHVQLMAAEESFFTEQDRQAFAFTLSTRNARDLTDELLVPLLETPRRDAVPLLVKFAERLWLPQPPVIARLGAVLDLLLEPPIEHSGLGEELVEVEYEDPIAEPRIFNDDAWLASQRELDALSADDPPVRLSTLAERARAEGGELAARLLVLRVLTAVAPKFEALEAGGAALLAAATDGERLPAGAYWGDDLLVGLLVPDDVELATRGAAEPVDLERPIQLRLIKGGAA